MSFCCLTDAAVLKYTIYKPISGVCEKKETMMVKLEYTRALRNKVKVDDILAHVTPYLLERK